MINFKKALLLGLLGVFTLSSCTKDEEDDTSVNEFPQELLIDGTRYDLGEGFIFNYGTSSDYQGANLDLNILSSGLDVIYDADGFPDSVTGSGFVMYLEMYSSDSTALTAGTYNMDTTGTGNLLTISNGEVFSYGTAVETEYAFVSGSIEVMRENGVYSLVGSFVEEGGKEIKMSYQKSIVVIDDN
jgi:hypothetical protein